MYKTETPSFNESVLYYPKHHRKNCRHPYYTGQINIYTKGNCKSINLKRTLFAKHNNKTSIKISIGKVLLINVNLFNFLISKQRWDNGQSVKAGIGTATSTRDGNGMS